ncbi:Mucin-associated surface protein (MASP) [Trypanosoma cruzi]|uniref:Mucin-associated surface protein (MASP), putative n=2 Tax=Trypanosoma cruzi TaxID=5693 RepID=Q4D8S1_TRYCC|nr:mucin-associated surface protein (MASP), putative [Trypanosoma cruzi]EAN88920.1 mucin-associated surface protein (MASP), putative [Trypanosoma cruzi]PWV17702.1 Mucin-associated surface protein (MASP) [Trypanosoma cruzi]|eukprot:XP_810771.1 mucin-associated surface protein (MASP) [Trypanosoma cruzi strain CL Brener]
MAMTMTGRVLLVCALCVLWCGAGGRCDEETAARGSDAEPPLASKPETPESGIPGTQPQVKRDNEEAKRPMGEGSLEGSEDNVVAKTEDLSEDDEGSKEEGNEETQRKKLNGRQEEHEENGPASGLDTSNGSSIESQLQTLQTNSSTGSSPPSSSLKAILDLTQTGIKENGVSVTNSPTDEETLEKDTRDNAPHGGLAKVTLPPPLEDSAAASGISAEYKKDEGQKDANLHSTAATVQDSQDDTTKNTKKETIPTAITTDTETTQHNDSSPAELTAPQSDAGVESTPSTNYSRHSSTEDAARLSETNDAEDASGSTETADSKIAETEKAPLATANTTDTTTNDSDGDSSTAVSHTTFPLLLLLPVACAAAAAVVAA